MAAAKEVLPRAVLDTNVLVSGLITPLGPSARLMDLAQRGEIQLLYDDRMIQEYRRVLRRPRFGFSPSAIELFMEFLESEGEHLVAKPERSITTDPSDQPFLEVALSGDAELLATGNLKDYPKGRQGRLRIVTPREALNYLMAKRE